MDEKFTYADLLQKLQQLTPDLLQQHVRFAGQESIEWVGALLVLDEDHVETDEGVAPMSAYADDENAANLPVAEPKGTVLLEAKQ